MADAVEAAPVKVYDISQQQPVAGTLHPEEVQPSIESGQFSLPKGAKVPVVNPDGQLGTIDAAEAPQAFKAGYQYATPKMQNDINFGSTGEQIKAGLEGAAEGYAGPLATQFETKVLGVNPANIRAREEANPTTSMLSKIGGLGAGILTGTGEAALLEHAGQGASQALGLGGEGAGILSKIGAHAAQGTTEMAILSSGDEISKMIKEDPEQSLGSALTNVGLSSLLGAAGGAAFGSVSPLWSATVGDKAAQFVEDMKGRFSERMANPDPIEGLTKEISDYHNNISGLNDEVWGQKGIKAQAIEQNMPEMNDTIKEATNGLAEKLNVQLAHMVENRDVYPARLVKQFEGQVSRILEAVTDPAATPAKIFDAVQTTKQWAQDFSKDAWKVSRFEEPYEFSQKVIGLSKELRPFLEDPKIWGEVGKVQQSINSAAHKFFPTLKDFESKFTEKLGGERVVSPGKVNTFYNQIGKPNSEIKREVLDNFFKASEKYRGEVNQAYAKIGQESPFQHSSLNQVGLALKKLTPGAKAADVIINKGLSRLAGESIGGALGAGAGSLAGHPWLGAIVGEHALGPIFSSVLPSIVKPLMDKTANGTAFKGVLDYGIAVAKGQTLIQKATRAMFKPGAEVLAPKLFPSEKERERLDKKLKEYAENPQELMNVGEHSTYYLPHHSIAMGSAAGRVVQYLNSIRPTVEKQSPLDSDLKPSKPQMAEYHKALDIAEQPLVVLNDIKDGTIRPQDVQHLQAMYPSLYQQLASGVQEELMKHASDGGEIPYHTRLGMSLFLGEPLDSTMTPTAAQSIQAVYQAPATPPQQQGMPKSSNSMQALNKMSSQFQTPQQARTQAHSKA